MSEKILPNCVGRLDPIVEAIREGRKDAAFAMLFAEQTRLKQKSDAIVDENRKAVDAWEKLSDLIEKIHEDPAAWEKARRECGWNPLEELVAESQAMGLYDTKPKLDAATLPIGTIMVLGGCEYEIDDIDETAIDFSGEGIGLRFYPSEVQELIDRGVEFRLPEGGA